MKKKSITEIKSIAKNFNKNFTQISANLAKHIGISSKSFDECINKHGNTHPEKVTSVNEFKDTFFISKMNKSASYDETSFNVVRKCFAVLHKPHLHIFNISLKTRIFPYKLKFLGLHHCSKAVTTMN